MNRFVMMKAALDTGQQIKATDCSFVSRPEETKQTKARSSSMHDDNRRKYLEDKGSQTERNRKFKWSGKILRSFRKRKTSCEVCVAHIFSLWMPAWFIPYLLGFKHA